MSAAADQIRSQYVSKVTGKRILVTGGNGYIGSHTVIELVHAGAIVTVIDNLCNSNLECLHRVEQIVGKPVEFIQVDLQDRPELESLVFQNRPPYHAVIHFAGLKAVGESVSMPLRYYQYNVYGSLNLLELMAKYDCRSIVFSSSATVYGIVKSNPINESAALGTTNPYGSTKLVIENILRELHASTDFPPPGDKSPPWSIAILRYFNPIGAHHSGTMGEDPTGIPNNLLPFVLQTAVGRRSHVTVFGNDWPTRDGTGVRDYIHVVDLAIGHLAALSEGLWGEGGQGACEAYNLGTGNGVSVLEMIQAVEAASGKRVPYQTGGKRSGDIAECYSDPSKARERLKWRTVFTVEEAVRDSWRWQSQNPHGFTGQP